MEGVGERFRTKNVVLNESEQACSWEDRVLLNGLVCLFCMIRGILLSYKEMFVCVCETGKVVRDEESGNHRDSLWSTVR